MKQADVKPGIYNLRGDIVEVTRVEPGPSPRSAVVHYVLRKKRRSQGHLAVGDAHSLGVVNFAAWATPAELRPSCEYRKCGNQCMRTPCPSHPPCDNDAARRCPICDHALCSGHSRLQTTMSGKSRLGLRLCSHCGAHNLPERDWRPA